MLTIGYWISEKDIAVFTDLALFVPYQRNLSNANGRFNNSSSRPTGSACFITSEFAQT